MAFILYKIVHNSFPTDSENMNPIRQLFLVEKSIFQFFENPIKYKPIEITYREYTYGFSDFWWIEKSIFQREIIGGWGSYSQDRWGMSPEQVGRVWRPSDKYKSTYGPENFWKCMFFLMVLDHFESFFEFTMTMFGIITFSILNIFPKCLVFWKDEVVGMILELSFAM